MTDSGHFEAEFAAYCGAGECLGLGNGSNAIELILRGCAIGSGDEVIVPSNTHVDICLAVPVEPDPATCTLDPERVEAALTPRTRAILAVHQHGRPADMGALARIASQSGLKLIAEGFPPTSLADAQVFSLGDARAVVTDDPILAANIRDQGSRLDPRQAAVLRVKLRHLDEWTERRRRIARRYLTELHGLPDLVLPSDDEGGAHVWTDFAVRHPERDWFRKQLAHAGVGTHIPPALRRRGFPIAEELAATEVCLPLHPHLTPEQVNAVVDAVCHAACWQALVVSC